MSATGRGAERQQDDFYVTQAWCVHALLAKLDLPGGRWLEPGAGDGAIVRAVQQVRDDIVFTTVELRDVPIEQRPPCWWWTGDFLAVGIESQLNVNYAVAIGNPPYRFAREFIEQALRFSKIVCFLLRLDFLGSRKRHEFWKRNPADVYVLPDRPNFVMSIKCKACNWRVVLPLAAQRPTACETIGCASKLQISTSDANEYGWFIWGMGGGKLVHLDPRPEGVMARDLIIDVNANETEEAAKARHAAEQVPSNLIFGNTYVLADGRAVVFEGTSSRFSFFAGMCNGAPSKFRLETASVQAWPCDGKGVDCQACNWTIAAEAAEGANSCPHCGAGAQ